MGINIKGQVGQQQATASVAQPTATGNVNFGLASRMSTFGSGGEVYEKIYQKFQEKIKLLNDNIKTGEKYHLIKLLKQNHDLNYSAIVIAETFTDMASAHILMIEKTGEYPTPLVENIGGVRYEVVRTPADALDQKYIEQTQLLVAETTGIALASVVVVDGTLVPSEFDVNNDNLIQDLFVNALNSIDSEVAIQAKNYKGINIADIFNNHRNGKFFVNLFFNSPDNAIFDQTGMPIRQDICISLSYKTTTQQNMKSVNQGSGSFELVKVYGYIDFEWTNPVMMNNMMTTQKFIPNFIITHIESSLVPTPDVLLLAVVSVLAVNEDMTWMQSLKPTAARKGEIDYNDIGALNIEGNIENNPTGYGQKIKTKVKEFTMVDFNKMTQMLIRPNLMISIDLPKAGPETWITSIFYHARFNRSKGAIKRIFDSLDTLTNGNAGNLNVPIFADVTNKIHGGYFKTKDGIFDLRVLSSYLGISNYIAETNQPTALITQYTNTLYNESIPSELRAAERKKFIDNMSNGTAVYKQYYDRVMFTSDFLIAAVTVLKAVGFSPVFSNMGASNDMFQRRNSVSFGQALLGQDVRFMGSTNMYNNFYMPFGYNRTF